MVTMSCCGAALHLVPCNLDALLQFASKDKHTIASNAGVEGAVVASKLLEQGNTDLGYDTAKGMMVSYNLHMPIFTNS
jgi:hypothetical protein